jgi:hypothetical protein
MHVTFNLWSWLNLLFREWTLRDLTKGAHDCRDPAWSNIRWSITWVYKSLPNHLDAFSSYPRHSSSAPKGRGKQPMCAFVQKNIAASYGQKDWTIRRMTALCSFSISPISLYERNLAQSPCLLPPNNAKKRCIATYNDPRSLHCIYDMFWSVAWKLSYGALAMPSAITNAGAILPCLFGNWFYVAILRAHKWV